MLRYVTRDTISVLFGIATENLETNYSFDCDVIEREGKHYINIRGVRTQVKYEDFSFKFESDTAISFVTETINRIVNAHWKLILVEVETHWKIVFGKIIQTILIPIFDKMAVQDFFE